jgi:hypothetical protein
MPRRQDRSWKQRRSKRCALERAGSSGATRQQLRVPWCECRNRLADLETSSSMINQTLTVVASLVLLSMPLDAQVAPKPSAPTLRGDSAASATAATAGCPGGNGIHISATSGTLTTDRASGVNTVIGLNQSVDTTLVFDISRKTWTRTNIAAAISLGLADESRGRYAICAGVTALMPSATLTISGARGRVHFIASLKDLASALRVGPSQ